MERPHRTLTNAQLDHDEAAAQNRLIDLRAQPRRFKADAHDALTASVG